jgi:hypothetical protein
MIELNWPWLICPRHTQRSLELVDGSRVFRGSAPGLLLIEALRQAFDFRLECNQLLGFGHDLLINRQQDINVRIVVQSGLTLLVQCANPTFRLRMCRTGSIECGSGVTFKQCH